MTKVFFVHDQQGSPDERKNVLEIAGFEVKLMQGSIELLIALSEETPAIVLMDVLIEGRNGFEAVRELDLRYPERSFPVVLCTRVYRARQFKEEAWRSGAQDYIVLPVGSDELVRRVHLAITNYTPPDRSTAAREKEKREKAGGKKPAKKAAKKKAAKRKKAA